MTPPNDQWAKTERCPQCHSPKRNQLNQGCQSKPYQPLHSKQWHEWHDQAIESTVHFDVASQRYKQSGAIAPPNDQYIKPIAERARKLDNRGVFDGYTLAELLKLFVELAEKLEPAEVREKK